LLEGATFLALYGAAILAAELKFGGRWCDVWRLFSKVIWFWCLSTKCLKHRVPECEEHCYTESETHCCYLDGCTKHAAADAKGYSDDSKDAKRSHVVIGRLLTIELSGRHHRRSAPARAYIYARTVRPPCYSVRLE